VEETAKLWFGEGSESERVTDQSSSIYEQEEAVQMLVSLWKITAVVYASILIAGEVLHHWLGCSRLALPLSYAFGMGSFYLWHLGAHSKTSIWPFSSVYASHYDHHWFIYPPTAAKFLSDKPLHSLAGLKVRPPWVPKWFPDCEHELVLILMIALNQFIIGPFLLGAPWRDCGCGFVFCMISGAVMVYTHESTHIRGHWAERFEWFQDLRALHLMHHRGAINTNFGMYSFLTDAIFGSYQDPADTDRILRPAQSTVHPMEKDRHPTPPPAGSPLAATIAQFTGKEQYKFGDISIEVVNRLKRASLVDFLAKFSLGL
jgi:hypothetical protein